MHIVGCDLHARYQQMAMLDDTTGELLERRLEHENGEARAFYASLPKPARVGIEATGHAQWFERLLEEQGHQLWVGNAAQIRAGVVRKQKTDQRDAAHLLDLLLSHRFPRIWIPSWRERDVRQLLRHRHQLVRFRVSVQNQLQALAMSQGVCRRAKLWSRKGRRELQGLVLGPWANRRKEELLELLDRWRARIEELDQAVKQEAENRAEAVGLMQQAGVGPVTALAFVLTVGPVERFARSKQLVSYLGLNPREHSSGGRQRLSSISKQGNNLLRFLLVEAAQTAARSDADLARMYQRLRFRRGGSVAKVAIARKLAVRLYWKLREGKPFAEQAPMQGSPEISMVRKTTSEI